MLCLSTDERIHVLESRVSHLSTCLLRLHEDVSVIAQSLNPSHIVRPLPVPDSIHARENMPGPWETVDAQQPNPDNLAHSDARGQKVDVAHISPQDPYIITPALEAVADMLKQSGQDAIPRKAQCHYTVTFDDPCSFILPMALQHFEIHDDWHEFVLFAAGNTTERCIAYDEKPLMILQRMREIMPETKLILRRVHDIESPLVLARRKFIEKRREIQNTKHEAMRLRAAPPGITVSVDSHIMSVRVLLTMQGGAESLANARTMGPAADIAFKTISHAVAIYPYVSERGDEFDIQPGDTFIVLSKCKGWWALRRDSVADGRGDVFLLDPVKLGVEIWTGWAPSGCLLELTRPMATILQLQASFLPPESPEKWQQTMMYAPLSLAYVPTSGTAAVMLTDFATPDHSFAVSAADRIRVFKRYNSWSYCIVDGPLPKRGWVPTWLVSRRPDTKPVAVGASAAMAAPQPPHVLAASGDAPLRSPVILRPSEQASSSFLQQW
mgnify:FL=1